MSRANAWPWRRVWTTFRCLLVVCGLGYAVPAYAIDDVLTPRAISLGSGLRAYASGGLAPLLNPSGMSLTRNYNIDVSYGFDVQSRGSSLYVSIADSITSRVAAGLYYQFVHSSPRVHYLTTGSPPASREGNEVGATVALPIGQSFLFGLNTKYTRVSTTVTNPDFDPTKAGSTKTITLDSTTTFSEARGFSLDAGFTLRLGQSFNIGVVGYNLIPRRSVEAPITLGTGLSYQAGKSVLFVADVSVYFNKYRDRGAFDTTGSYVLGRRRTTVRFGGGIEFIAGKRVPLRVGAYHDTGEPGTYVSAGLGYLGSKFGVDVAYQQQVNHGRDSLIVGGFRLFLQ